MADVISRLPLLSSAQALGCTGGGAFKFEESFLQRLGVRMLQMDEMECLVRGMQFALANIPEACYTYRPPVEVKKEGAPPGGETEEGGGSGGDEPGPDPRDNLRNKRMREMAEVSAKRVSDAAALVFLWVDAIARAVLLLPMAKLCRAHNISFFPQPNVPAQCQKVFFPASATRRVLLSHAVDCVGMQVVPSVTKTRGLILVVLLVTNSTRAGIHGQGWSLDCGRARHHCLSGAGGVIGIRGFYHQGGRLWRYCVRLPFETCYTGGVCDCYNS